MNEVKIGDSKKNIILKHTEDQTIIQLTANKFEDSIELLLTKEQLIVALKFITMEDTNNE